MPDKTLIRPYSSTDEAKLLQLFALNTPSYFSPEERGDFIDYLNHHIERYFVIELEGEIVGAGGINFSEDRSIGKISWDLFHPEHQGKGLGSLLTLYRLNLLKQEYQVKRITVRTSQLVYLFYEKMGFVLQEVIPNYWAEGFDLYRMELTINSISFQNSPLQP